MVLFGIGPTLTPMPPIIGLRSIMITRLRVMSRRTGAHYRKIVIKVRHREFRDRHSCAC
jgi:hypothetical protein